jgi:hypothetical protein
MSPIDPNPNTKIFSDDYHKFVLQDQPIIADPYATTPKQKFTLDATKKKKKAEKKEDSPWLPKKPKKKEADEETEEA